MLNHYKYERIIATIEWQNQKGEMITETKSFNPEVSIREIINWANQATKVIITIDETDAEF